MSDNHTTVNFGGILVPLLTVLFIGLKLTGYIDWSWWWVLSPLWIGFALFLAVMAVLLALAVWIRK